MAGPPDTLEASELWLALTKIPRPHKLVDIPRCFPGTDTPVGQVAIWPLSQEEQMAANAEADKFTKALLKAPQKRDEANFGYQDTFANEVAVQILSRVCRDPNNLEKPAFPSPKLMRQHLTADEEMEGWIRRIASGGSAFPFAGLSSEAQLTLVLFMARRIANFQTEKSSAGSPQDEALTNDGLAEEMSED